MTTETKADYAPLSEGRRPGEWAKQAWRSVRVLRGLLLEVYKKGLLLPIAAPLIFALVAVPEFVQHIVEIRLGMFQSLAGFRAHALDGVRMGFGAAKILGLLLCMLLTARFWWFEGSLRRTFRLGWRDGGRIVLALGLLFAAGLPMDPRLVVYLPGLLKIPAIAASWLLSFLLTAYLVAAVIGDREMTFGRSMRRGWVMVPGLAILVAAAFYPAMRMHALDHKLALGQAEPLVWLLMGWDALVVGLLASLTGSALYVAYRAGTVPRL